jgi:hypothetical protein
MSFIDDMHIDMYNVCMPTIMTINSVKFCVYFNDHGIAHCHVIKNEFEAKIIIETGVCVAVNGFSKRDVSTLCKIVKANAATLLQAWEDYNE